MAPRQGRGGIDFALTPAPPLLCAFSRELPASASRAGANLSTYPSQRFKSFCYDDDDDYEKSTIPLNAIDSQIPPFNAITPVLLTIEPEDSVSMEDEHLSTIPEKESDKVIKSSVENLVPIPKIDHLDAIPDSVQSLLNRANMIIFLIEEFADELAPSSNPPEIVEAEFDPEEDIRLIEKLLNDDSSPHSPKELNSEIPDAS
ncbi:hypothetical protein Tco_0435645 [Tanacetum coccineum]